MKPMLNISQSIDYSCTDYCTIFEGVEIELSLENLYYTELRCIEEHFMFDNLKKTNILLLEDVTVNNESKDAERLNKRKNMSALERGWDSVTNIVKKLIEFIKRAIKGFMGKANELINGESEWLDKNIKKLQSIKSNFWNDCTINLYPYFDNGFVLINNSIESNQGLGFVNLDNDNKINSILDIMAEKDHDEMEVIKKISMKVSKNYSDGNFASACKITYRNGDDVKAYKGGEAENLCLSILKYAKNYDDIVNRIDKDTDEFEKRLEKIEKDLESKRYEKAVKEYHIIFANDITLYSLLEDSFIYNIPGLNNLDIQDTKGNEILIVREDGNDNNANNGTINTNNSNNNTNQTSGDNQPKNSSVSVSDTNNNNTNSTNNNNTQQKEAQTRLKNKLKLVSYALEAETARMTVAEEAFRAGIRTLKSVLKSAEERGDINFEKVETLGDGEIRAQRKTENNVNNNNNNNNTPKKSLKDRAKGMVNKAKSAVKGLFARSGGE